MRHFTKQSTAVYVIYEPNYTTIFNLAATDFRSKNSFISRAFNSSCESHFILLKQEVFSQNKKIRDYSHRVTAELKVSQLLSPKTCVNKTRCLVACMNSVANSSLKAEQSAWSRIVFFRHLPTILKKMSIFSAQQQVTPTRLYASNKLHDGTPQKRGLAIAMFVTASKFHCFLVT